MARAALIGAVLALLVAAPARADSIVYRCFPNLCRVAADGSGQAPLTRDGVAGGPAYAWLSATPSGSRLGASLGNRAYVLDGAGRKLAGPLASSGGAVLVTQISPDGGQVATIETVIETRPRPAAPDPVPVPGRADGSGRDTVARSTVATAWLGGRLLRDDAADDPPFAQQICLLASNTDFPCERLVAADPGRDLRDPAVSPDGTLVAAARAPGEIAIYSAGTAALVRVVSSGPSDSAPRGRPTASGSRSPAVTAASGSCPPRAAPRGASWPRGSSRCGCAPAARCGSAPRSGRAPAACGSSSPTRRAAPERGCSAGRAGAGARWPRAELPSARPSRSASHAAGPCCERGFGRPAG